MKNKDLKSMDIKKALDILEVRISTLQKVYQDLNKLYDEVINQELNNLTVKI
jgi:hypothetical protein